jgi:hypothetical protein
MGSCRHVAAFGKEINDHTTGRGRTRRNRGFRTREPVFVLRKDHAATSANDHPRSVT